MTSGSQREKNIDLWLPRNAGAGQESEKGKLKSLKKHKSAKRVTRLQPIPSLKPKHKYIVIMAQTSKSLLKRNGTSTLVYKSRLLLINCGKVFPFLICAIVAISYIECFKAMYFEDYLEFSDGIYLNKPISFSIASFF